MRFFLYCIAAILSLVACKTSSPTPESAESPVSPMVKQATPTEERGLLWEITGQGLTQPSYLFGTIHMISSKDFFLPEGTLSAIDVSDKMFFEIDMSDMNDPMKLMPLLQKAFMKGDTTLSDLVTPEEYMIIEEHFEKMGLPLMFLKKIKPMFLTVFATEDFDPNGLNNGNLKSYELEFASIAEDGGKETGGLETIDFQISVFDDIPYRDQAAMLVESIKSSDSENDTFQQLINLYLDQDVYGLYELMKTDESLQDHEDVLLTKRNQNWIPIMAEEMNNQQSFFAFCSRSWTFGRASGRYHASKSQRLSSDSIQRID